MLVPVLGMGGVVGRHWLLRVALVVALGSATVARVEAEPLPERGSCEGCNVILVSLDTLRRDRLEPYGYDRPTSPEIAKLAERALLFERAYSTSTSTAESHMSLFTSLYPSVHGVATGRRRESGIRRLAADVPTLAGVLKSQGYATAGFHDGGNVTEDFGFSRGFDRYERKSFIPGRNWYEISQWMSARGEAPFFLFLHSYHVHDPYTPNANRIEALSPGYEGGIRSDRRELTRRSREACENVEDCSPWHESNRIFWSSADLSRPADVAHLSALYDAEIQELDSAIPRMIAAFDRLPRDTLVVFLSDHGEAFLEHGKVMHQTLHEEIVRIPLLVLHPRVKASGTRSRRTVSLLDVGPTLLDWLGLAPPDSFQGRPVHATTAPSEAPIFAEQPSRNTAALIDGGKKLLLSSAEEPDPEVRRALDRVAAELALQDAQRFGAVELYDLATDPDERNDLGIADPTFEPRSLRSSGSVARS